MAIMYKGENIQGLFYKNKKISGLWYQGKKIYSAYLPTGTILLKQFAQDSLRTEKVAGDFHIYQGPIPLPVELKKIKTGIRFYVDIGKYFSYMNDVSQTTGKDYATAAYTDDTFDPSTGIVDIPKTSFGTSVHFITANIGHDDGYGKKYTTPSIFEVLISDAGISFTSHPDDNDPNKENQTILNSTEMWSYLGEQLMIIKRIETY